METFKLPIEQTQHELRNCSNCVHAIHERIGGQVMQQLVCHRFPPQILLVPSPRQNVSRIQTAEQMQGTAMMAQSMFPVVAPQMFCHSHTLRGADPNAAVEVREP